MNNKLQDISKRLNQVFQDDPWYGESIMDVLENLNIDDVNKIPREDFNSIARIVLHMITWREFAIKSFQGDDSFNVQQNDANDWKEITITTEQEWESLLRKLKETQSNILSILQASQDSILNQKVPTRTYSIEYLLEGIIQHDVYHLGQITLVKKLINP